MDAVTDELLALERAGWKALRRGDAAAFYGDVLTDDGVMIVADGTELGRDAAVAALSGSSPWTDYAIESAHVVGRVAHAATLVYRATARREDGETFTAAMTSTYVRVSGRWRLAVYTQTPC